MHKPRVFTPKKPPVSRVFNGKAGIDLLYHGEWTEYSRRFLELNPKCYSCGEQSQATDHLKVHLGNWDLFHDRGNHIPLCHKCHNTITAKFDRRIPQDLEGKLKWLAANRARNGLAGPVKVLPWKWKRQKRT